jgi:hypothetical protein
MTSADEQQRLIVPIIVECGEKSLGVLNKWSRSQLDPPFRGP